MKRFLAFLSAVAVILLMSPSAGAQQQSSAPPAKQSKAPAKKAKRVWTEEELPALRKPVDEYAASKAKAEEPATSEAAAKPADAAKPAAEGEAVPAKDASVTETDEGSPTDKTRGDMLAGVDVDTPEQVEAQMALKRTELQGMEDVAFRAKVRFDAEGDPAVKADIQNEVDGANGHVESLRAELAWLDTRLTEVVAKAKAAAGQAAAPATPPAQTPPPTPPPAQAPPPKPPPAF